MQCLFICDSTKNFIYELLSYDNECLFIVLKFRGRDYSFFFLYFFGRKIQIISNETAIKKISMN